MKIARCAEVVNRNFCSHFRKAVWKLTSKSVLRFLSLWSIYPHIKKSDGLWCGELRGHQTSETKPGKIFLYQPGTIFVVYVKAPSRWKQLKSLLSHFSASASRWNSKKSSTSCSLLIFHDFFEKNEGQFSSLTSWTISHHRREVLKSLNMFLALRSVMYRFWL